jgi:hypothetical protein
MSIILVGEIINSCDAVTGFNVGNISTDDDFVEGTGAIGLKASVGVTEIYTTTLGATSPYDLSSATAELGAHIIMWFNTKTSIDLTDGLGIVVGNGTDRGYWDLLGSSFYKGGFVTRVVDTALDFDTVSAGTWTVGGNPAQLSNITEVGGQFHTLTSIMGNFNNIQLDQMIIGSGVRADGGTLAAPNTFEAVRTEDETVNFWGWWSKVAGAFLGKGKLFIGPQSDHASSVFVDSAFSVNFADERVGSGFYEIETRGNFTAVDWTLSSISAANANNSRWNLTIDPSTSGFQDTNGVWTGADVITLTPSSTLNSTTIINSNTMISRSGLTGHGAIIDGITVLSAPTATNASFLETDLLDDITNSSFLSDGGGHAIRLTSLGIGTMDWNNTVTGYASTSGSTGREAIHLNVATGGLTINVATGASTPSIRTDGAFVNLVVAPVTTLITVTDPDGVAIEGARVYLLAAAGGPIAQGTIIFNTLTDINGQVTDTRSLGSDQPVEGWSRKGTTSPVFKQANIVGTIDSDTGLTLTVQMIPDE